MKQALYLLLALSVVFSLSFTNSSEKIALNNLRKIPNQTQISPSLITTFLKKYPTYQKKASSSIITLIDFSLPSTQKRLWVIDLSTTTILAESYVAHGKNSGVTNAEKFSNRPNSYQSSLGFYKTGKTYYGKHGYSLRLYGLEKNINDLAFQRAIVMHPASYATEQFIEEHGRLGRSFGCPALPPDVSQKIIDYIKDESLLFIYHPSY